MLSVQVESHSQFHSHQPSIQEHTIHNSQISSRFLGCKHCKPNPKWQSMAIESDASSFLDPIDADSADKTVSGFCIIESTVEDFSKMQLEEIQDNIRSRRNKITWKRYVYKLETLNLESQNDAPDSELPDFPSFIPFLPPLTSANLKQYYATCFSLIGGIMIFGGLLAPALELKLGIGGTSYEDFIRNMHLPLQFRISCLCSLYKFRISCSSYPIATLDGNDQPLSPPTTERCSNCSGAGKVMCPTCLCTGMAMASEHDPRIDPFD
ncbi:hypothetical protein MKW94_019578 [Papaver nudicaule]|uniref:Uncharacterized protein n=1 Tax=Papaver nudicaule TaxID=74823 RepID=A0AA41RQT9_PAPNU|nr:hypothetical protein [Papaver nudicaule]